MAAALAARDEGRGGRTTCSTAWPPTTACRSTGADLDGLRGRPAGLRRRRPAPGRRLRRARSRSSVADHPDGRFVLDPEPPAVERRPMSAYPPLLRQGPRHLRRRRRPPADGHLRPHLRLRRRHGRAHPRQGPGAHRHVGVLVRAARRRRRQPPDLHRPRRPARRTRRSPTLRRPGRCSAARPRCCRSSASCGATSPARRGRSTRRRGPCTARRCPPACWSRPSCPSRCSPRRPRPRSATTTRTSPSTAAVDLVGRRAGRAGPRRLARALPPGRGVGGRAGDHHRRHQVRARPGRRRAGRLPTRCSRPTRPASGRPTSGSRAPPRRRSTSSRCATTSTASTGTRRRRRRRCPPRSSTPPSARYVEAYERITGRSLRRLARRRRLTVAASRRRRVRDDVRRWAHDVLRARRGDAPPRHRRPAGRHHRAVAARPRLRRGRAACGSARPSASRSRPPTRPTPGPEVEDLCERFLTNPVIEDAAIQLTEGVAGLMAPEVGVVLFPGSNCEHDVVEAVRASAATPSSLWHGDAIARRRRRRRRPRRVRPRRLPAARRHRPVLAGHGRGRATSPLPAARSSASATASRCSPRPVCCPARCRRTPASSSCARPSSCGSSRPRRCSPARSSRHRAAHPDQPLRGQLHLLAETLARAAGRGPDRAALRRQPQRLGRRHRRHLQRGRQRRRPHAPPRAGQSATCSAPTDGRPLLPRSWPRPGRSPDAGAGRSRPAQLPRVMPAGFRTAARRPSSRQAA